jgi:hypothetical protein
VASQSAIRVKFILAVIISFAAFRLDPIEGGKGKGSSSKGGNSKGKGKGGGSSKGREQVTDSA